MTIITAELPDTLKKKMEGPRPPASYESDGCSGAPDTWGGVDIRPACHWHDYSYFLGGTREDRLEADRRFYRNLRACDLGRFKAGVYYRRVRLFGLHHFGWEPGHEPSGWRVWVSNFFDRYLTW